MISRRGLDLIAQFEGKHTRLPDGRYAAYRCPANVWTIYVGCTKGVTEGMIVTDDEGQVMLAAELADIDRAVTRLAPLANQNEHDAFVSLAYNIGPNGFRSSTVLKRFLEGDKAAAARGFAMWNKVGCKELTGLTRRRAAESALFLDPIDDAPAMMPQKIDEPAGKGMAQSRTGWAATISAVTVGTATVKEVMTVATDATSTAKLATTTTGQALAALPPAAALPLWVSALIIGLGIVAIGACAFIWADRRKKMQEHGI